jgi:hypothetical protein
MDYMFPQQAALRSVRESIMECYLASNPSKVGDVDKLMDKFKGTEKKLMRELRKKYGEDYTQCRFLDKLSK